MNRFYYIKNFTDMRCKYSRVLSELKELRKELAKARSEACGYRKKIAKLEEQLKGAKADKYGKSRRRTKDDDKDSGMDHSELRRDLVQG